MTEDFKAYRLTRIADVVRWWPFFKKGIEYEARYLRYTHPLDVYRQILFHLVKQPDSAWVQVALLDGEPVAFVMAHEITPLFAETREFEVSMFYFQPGYRSAIHLLQSQLDTFCRSNSVSFYYLTTSSRCGAAKRVFNETWRGLEHSNTVFKRKVSP